MSLLCSSVTKKMPEGISAENLMNNIMETLGDGLSKQKPGSFFGEEKSNSASAQIKRLFGRQKPVHHILGGGKCNVPSPLFHYCCCVFFPFQ